MNTIDMVLGAYLVMQVFLGWRRGFAGKLVDILSRVLSVGGALLLCRPAAVLVNGYTGAFDSVSAYIQRAIGSPIQQVEWLVTVMRVTGLDAGADGSLSAGIRTTADLLARLTVTVACLVALWIILRIGLGALGRVIVLPFEHGPVAQINSLLGGALGGVVGLSCVGIGWLVMMWLTTRGFIDSSVIESSVILRFVGGIVTRMDPLVLRKGGV